MVICADCGSTTRAGAVHYIETDTLTERVFCDMQCWSTWADKQQRETGTRPQPPKQG